MNKTKRNIIIIVSSVVAAIIVVLAIVLPLTLIHNDENVEHTVTFDSNGGSVVASVTVAHDSTIAEPDDPTRQGYTFVGWFSNAALTKKWTFATDKVTSDMTLYAKWDYNATEGLGMVLNGTSYTVTGLGNVSNVEDVVIPDSYNNKPVTTIASDAFANVKSIVSVYIPASVTAVKDRAFINCPNLKLVTIAGEAELGARVFEDCSKLESVVLPDNLKEINRMTFKSCVSLVDINVPSSLTSIGEQAFFECKKLPSFAFPSGLTSIGEQAFSSCESLTEVKLPATIKELGRVVEDGEVVIREQNVFTGCVNLETLTVESSNNATYYSQNSNCIISVRIENGNTVRTLVTGCKTSVIPDNVTVIGESAFQGCRGLTNANIISRNVTTIGAHAFDGCVGLGSVVIPSSVLSIGDYAFTNCYNLANVNIAADTLTSIGREAFSHCALIAFTIPKSVTFIGAGAFYNAFNQAVSLTYRGTSNQMRNVVTIGRVPDGEENPYNEMLNIYCSEDGEFVLKPSSSGRN